MEKKILMQHLRYFLSTSTVTEEPVSKSLKLFPTFCSQLVASIQGAEPAEHQQWTEACQVMKEHREWELCSPNKGMHKGARLLS